jgi:hypothetical protein
MVFDLYLLFRAGRPKLDISQAADGGNDTTSSTRAGGRISPAKLL